MLMNLKKDAMGCIQQKHRIEEARLILQSGIYIFVTNISEGTAFLLQGHTILVTKNIYSGP